MAIVVLHLAVGIFLGPPQSAAQPPASPAGIGELREVLVPVQDLKVLLEASPQRVMLSREEFLLLKQRAIKVEREQAPISSALLAAEYDMTIEDGRAVMRGQFEIEILRDGLHAVPLLLSGVSLLSATLDDEPAALGTAVAGGPIQLFVAGQGRHILNLEMVLPVAVSAAQQQVAFHVPAPPSAKMQISVPGNVEIKRGADVVFREVDAATLTTRFQILVPSSPASITMSLNNRRLRDERAVVARSLIMTHIQDSHESIEMSVSMGILHGAVQVIRFIVPDDLEITDVNSDLLERWKIVAADVALDEVVADALNAGRVVEVELRQAATKPFSFTVSGVRNRPVSNDGSDWSFPQMKLLDVDGQVAVLGVATDPQIRVLQLQAADLIPIDRSVFGDTVADVLLAYYAPSANFSLTATVQNPAPQLDTLSSFLMTIGRRELTVDGGFILEPQIQKIFSFDFTIPSAWKVHYINDAAGNPLKFEAYSGELLDTYHVRLPQGAAPGEAYQVEIRAAHLPVGWLAEWDSRQISFPLIRVLNADIERGALAALTVDDLAVRPDTLDGLSVLTEREKQEFGLATKSDLAYRFEAMPYSGQFTVEPMQSQLTAKTLSFYKLTPQGVEANYEVTVTVREATARKLVISLPESTPDEVTIIGIFETEVKEYSASVSEGRRQWEILLAEDVALDSNRNGSMQVALRFNRPLSEAEQDGERITFPDLLVNDVIYQSGIMSVEGHAEFDVAVETVARRVDVGELSNAVYPTGRRLLGAFGYAGIVPELTATIEPRDSYHLPTVIVERAELFTGVSVNGIAQTVARFQLRSKPVMLMVELPAEAKLWSVVLDDTPLAPQHLGEVILVTIPPSAAGDTHDLRIVFENQFSKFRVQGFAKAGIPQLYAAQEGSQRVAVPVADVKWSVAAPDGWSVNADSRWTARDVAEPIRWRSILNTVQMGTMVGGVATKQDDGDDYYGSDDMEWAENGDGGENAAAAMPIEDADEDFAPPAPESNMPQVARRPEAPLAMDKPFITTVVPVVGPSDEPTDLGGQVANGALGEQRDAGNWALKGMRSLPIDWSDDFDQLHDVATFEALGGEVEISLNLVDRNRIVWIGAAAFYLTLLLGFLLAFRQLRSKIRFVAVAVVVALLVPYASGSSADWELVRTSILQALAIVIPIQIAFGIGCLLIQKMRPSSALAGAALCLAVSLGSLAHGQEKSTADIINALRNLAETPNVTLPDNAIIIPFDTNENGDVLQRTDQVLVPYSVYSRLQELANPTKPIGDEPPAPYALSGATYQTTLADPDHLEVTGELRFNVFSNAMTAIPLTLRGGVIVAATVNDRPAKLQVVSAHPADENTSNAPPAAKQTIQQSEPAPVPAGAVHVLYLNGRGVHTLSLRLRFPLTRQGGWRRLNGQVPVAPATVLELTVADAKTDVRFVNIPDRLNHSTTEANQKLRVALANDGNLVFQFRPQVAAGEVDRSLTVDSLAVLDVQEDGLRLAWRLQYEFRRGRRSTLTARIPEGYLLEKVLGDNVRGWEVDNGQLDVELLKDVTERESITVFLSRRDQTFIGEPADVPMPVVVVPDAMLHVGLLSVRRSPRLELSVQNPMQLSRADGNDLAADELMRMAGEEEGPLTIRPFQTYRFAGTEYSATIRTSQISEKSEADVQSILRVSPRRTELEMRVRVSVKDLPVHQVAMELPAGFEIRTISETEWVTTEIDAQQRLTIYLAEARVEPFFLVLRGVLPAMAEDGTLDLPKVVVRDVIRQTGQMVVQVDPAYRVQPGGLISAQTVPLERANQWLTEDQRRLAQGGIALQLSGVNYQGTLSIIRRTPDVRVTTLTNIRVSDQSIEETILIEFQVLEAGIRELRFQLPSSLAEARIRAPSLRAKTITPVAGQDVVDVLLELQDELMDEIRVVVEQDRLATPDSQFAPIPRMLTGTVEQQYVTLQNEGRDELIVESADGLIPLSDSQRRWRSLVDLDITQGFEVNRGAAAPVLKFHNEVRETLKTADATIDHAEITMVVDAAGNYRTRQILYVENSTEPYLEVELPEDANLWTTHVDGEPVKPAAVNGKPRHVRIPLVRTQVGDLDYPVKLIYAGRIENLASLSTVAFPFIKTININVKQTQVALHLPKDYRWMNFRGAAQINREHWMLGFQTYLGNEIAKQTLNLSGGSRFEQKRAALAILELEEQVYEVATPDKSNEVGKKYSEQLIRNGKSVEQAKQAYNDGVTQQTNDVELRDNREALNELFSVQANNRATNIVTNNSGNFYFAPTTVDGEGAEKSEKPPSSKSKLGQFNRGWLDNNKLAVGDQQQRQGKADAEKPSYGKGRNAQRRGEGSGSFGNISRQIDLITANEEESIQMEQSSAGQGQAFSAGSRRNEGRDAQQLATDPFGQSPLLRGRAAGMADPFGSPSQTRSPMSGKDFATSAGQGYGPAQGSDQIQQYPSNLSLVVSESTEVDGSLASVDLQIPERGATFYFQATRGAVELTAQPVRGKSTWGMATAIACFIGLVGVWMATRRLGR